MSGLSLPQAICESLPGTTVCEWGAYPFHKQFANPSLVLLYVSEWPIPSTSNLRIPPWYYCMWVSGLSLPQAICESLPGTTVCEWVAYPFHKQFANPSLVLLYVSEWPIPSTSNLRIPPWYYSMWVSGLQYPFHKQFANPYLVLCEWLAYPPIHGTGLQYSSSNQLTVYVAKWLSIPLQVMSPHTCTSYIASRINLQNYIYSGIYIYFFHIQQKLYNDDFTLEFCATDVTTPFDLLLLLRRHKMRSSNSQ